MPGGAESSSAVVPFPGAVLAQGDNDGNVMSEHAPGCAWPEPPAQRRPLPFGLRIDKWRSFPQPGLHAPISTRYGRSITSCTKVVGDIQPDGERDPLALGAGPWRIQDLEESTAHAISAADDVQSIRGLQSPLSRASCTSISSPMMPGSPKKSAVLAITMASKMLHGKRYGKRVTDENPVVKKDKSDTEWVMERMLELMNNLDNILAHGFNDTDTKMLALFSQHLKVKQGDVFANAGDPCAYVAMILEGRLAAYHKKTRMDTHEAGSHVGTMGLTADNTTYTFTLIAEEDTFLAMLPHQKLLAYINDLAFEREEEIMTYCFEVLFVKNLEMNHKREVFEAATVMQNSFRAHIARREFWRIRNHLEAPSAKIIQRIWRGHRMRKWLW